MSVVVVTGAASGMGRACVESLRGMAEVLVAVDLKAPAIDGTVGVACDISDWAAVDALVAQVKGLGTFRALAHAAGISPMMADARRVFEVDLVRTHLLLDAFEDLVAPGSAAVCFTSVAAYQIAPFVDPSQDALLDNPLAPDFLDQAAGAITDNGHACAVAKRAVVRATARGRAVGTPRRPGQLARPGRDRHPDGEAGIREAAGDAADARRHAAGAVRPTGRGRCRVAFLLSDAASFVSGIDVLVDGAMLQGMAAAAQ